MNYALTLEHLESTFYREGMKNFTHTDFADAGFGDTFFENLKTVAKDEESHVDFLTMALKGTYSTQIRSNSN